ncbi:EAP30/Vps36 family-domain-containing protein [Chlamydoabsidia padenii]|nr:EAP30/Vps36 family-domain-containing protein [Chlamydoabsidia padenii]
MKYFKPCHVSPSSYRPELSSKESLILQQGNTGLYEGKAKLEGYQDGVLYLTSHRIIYVDNQRAVDHSVDIPLKAIIDIDQYSGFLRSSPKLILYVSSALLQDTTPPAVSNSDSLSVQVAKTMQLAATVGIWTCTICSHDNTLLTDKCDLCGVRTVNPPTLNGNHQVTITTATTASPPTPGTCPTCTFINHPSMIQCEMCDTPLDRSTTTTNSMQQSSPITFSSPISISPPSSLSATNQHSIQLSFRKGGSTHFLTKLNTALSNKAWIQSPPPTITPHVEQQQQQRKGMGLQGIQQRMEQVSTETNETMTDAFQDLDRLIAKANDMVKLAENISAKMNKSDPNDPDISTLRGYMVDLGISNPVTKGTAGSIYHQELSRELAEFLDKFYTNKENDLKPLTDIYCIFNRARGVALISPEDLYKACQQFEILNLPYRLRPFNGLLVVQSISMNDELVSKKILDLVKSHDGHLTALELAHIEQWALTVALEQLKMTEQKGLLCRDEGPGGLVFYENLFIT